MLQLPCWNRQGELIDIVRDRYDGALARTKSLLTSGKPIFEAAFSAAGAIAFADVLSIAAKDSISSAAKPLSVRI